MLPAFSPVVLFMTSPPLPGSEARSSSRRHGDPRASGDLGAALRGECRGCVDVSPAAEGRFQLHKARWKVARSQKVSMKVAGWRGEDLRQQLLIHAVQTPFLATR